MDKLGTLKESVQYGQTRTILDVLDEPVLAYGLGLAGMVVIYKTKQNYPRASSYSLKGLFSKRPDGGFSPMDWDYALDVIKNNKYIVDKKIDEKALDLCIAKEKYERPEIGRIKIKKTERYTSGEIYYEEEYEYVVKRMKNKSYSVFTKGAYDSNFTRYDNGCFLSEYNKAITDDKNFSLIESTVPDEIIKKIEMQIAAKKI